MTDRAQAHQALEVVRDALFGATPPELESLVSLVENRGVHRQPFSVEGLVVRRNALLGLIALLVERVVKERARHAESAPSATAEPSTKLLAYGGLQQSRSVCLCPQVQKLTENTSAVCWGCKGAARRGEVAPPPCPQCGKCGAVHIGLCSNVPEALKTGSFRCRTAGHTHTSDAAVEQCNAQKEKF